jgi:nucleoid DNA-binding protein
MAARAAQQGEDGEINNIGRLTFRRRRKPGRAQCTGKYIQQARTRMCMFAADGEPAVTSEE